MVKSRNFVLVKAFDGEPKESDFKIVEEDLPALKDGEYRVEALFWSVDPYMRAYITPATAPIGQVMMGGQVARVIETKNADFKISDHVYGHLGWRTHTNVSMKVEEGSMLPCYKLPDFKGLPLSYGVGSIGMPGNTAYFGFLKICKPQPGETVVVSGAAGAVGSIVGQIAKIKGCKVVGIVGSDDKAKWIKDELKFDEAINYKTQDVSKELAKLAPQGVDCYFDNVGGVMSSNVIYQMNMRGRISVCGSISAYNKNSDQMPQAPILQPSMVFKQLSMEGFVVHRWRKEWQEGLVQVRDWIKEGKIVAKETVTEGFENMPKAFIGMLRGENTGKAVVKAV